jgi:hypothetical protein
MADGVYKSQIHREKLEWRPYVSEYSPSFTRMMTYGTIATQPYGFLVGKCVFNGQDLLGDLMISG